MSEEGRGKPRDEECREGAESSETGGASQSGASAIPAHRPVPRGETATHLSDALTGVLADARRCRERSEREVGGGERRGVRAGEGGGGARDGGAGQGGEEHG